MGQKTTKTFKCRQCGAKMKYAPGKNMQVCPYCNFENAIEHCTADVQELDFLEALNQLGPQEQYEQLVVKCPQCAAEITAEPDIVAQDCCFCGSPIISTAHCQKLIKPKCILPFAIEKNSASSLYSNWLNKLWLAPNNLKKLAYQDNNIQGIYVPYWTYDSNTTSHYTGQKGVYYWVTESYTTRVNGKTVYRTRNVRKTRWYPASGTVKRFFDDVLVLASKTLPAKYAYRLEPWDLTNLVSYKDDFLSGFKAQSYQLDLSMGFGRAKEIIDEQLKIFIKGDIGGDEQIINSVNTSYKDITFKHLLLPVWLSTYRYKNKSYTFLVNGRTGQVQGQRPYSWIKIGLLGIAALATAAALAYYYYNNFM